MVRNNMSGLHARRRRRGALRFWSCSGSWWNYKLYGCIQFVNIFQHTLYSMLIFWIYIILSNILSVRFWVDLCAGVRVNCFSGFTIAGNHFIWVLQKLNFSHSFSLKRQSHLHCLLWPPLPKISVLVCGFISWALYSVPVIHMSVFMPIPCCFHYSSFVFSSIFWNGIILLNFISP